jgi:2-hydroxychromene-2-carboxylate isomerase
MGELISLADRLADRSRPSHSASPAFFYDVCCPFSYLAAERIERLLGEVEWVPVPARAVGQAWQLPEGARAAAERRAAELRLPLVWPDRFPLHVPGLLRAASYAAGIGSGAQFALAAMRLAFCGGFDLEDPEILAEAAAAAGIPLDECFAAIGDPAHDAVLNATATGLGVRGVGRLPALRIGPRLIDGEYRLAEAAALLRAPAAVRRPLAPVG